MMNNLPYRHTALCEDHSLSQVLSLLVSSYRGYKIPPTLNHRNPCHKSHSADPPPLAYIDNAPPQAHRIG